MFYFSRGEKVALVLLLAALIGAAGAMWWMGSRATTPTEPFFVDAPASAASDQRVTVHVCGEVVKPGLYAVAGGTRAHQVLELAGGTTKNADLSAVNLAAEVQDGQQISVPSKDSGAAAPAPVAVPSPAPAKAPQQPHAPKPPFTGKVNINRATAAQLDVLPGIGPAYAQKIVEYRSRLKAETGQGFTRLEQLMEIPGIGPKRFADVRDHVTL